MSCNLDFQSCTIENGGFAGVSTDADGLLQSGGYVGEQAGSCGGTLTEDFLQMPTSVTYSPEDVTELREYYGVNAGTDTVILNVEASQPGNVCIDISQQVQTRSVIEQLAGQGTCLFAGSDDTRCATLEALQRAYRTKYGEEPPMTWTQSIWNFIKDFAPEIGILIGIAIVFGKVVPWLNGGGRGGPGAPGAPSTGSGEASSAATEQTPEVDASERNQHSALEAEPVQWPATWFGLYATPQTTEAEYLEVVDIRSSDVDAAVARLPQHLQELLTLEPIPVSRGPLGDASLAFFRRASEVRDELIQAITSDPVEASVMRAEFDAILSSAGSRLTIGRYYQARWGIRHLTLAWTSGQRPDLANIQQAIGQWGRVTVYYGIQEGRAAAQAVHDVPISFNQSIRSHWRHQERILDNRGEDVWFEDLMEGGAGVEMPPQPIRVGGMPDGYGFNPYGMPNGEMPIVFLPLPAMGAAGLLELFGLGGTAVETTGGYLIPALAY